MVELLEKDGVKIDEHVENVINETLDKYLIGWVDGLSIYAFPSVRSIYEKVKEKLLKG